ncbi:uncharacterized protein LOC143936036 [Lithobates pipiens]
MSRDPEEVWSPEYDSTWEEEGEEKTRGQREPGNRRQFNCRNRMRAARDLQNYRHGYVNDRRYQCYANQPPQASKPNLEFYQGNRRFEPDGLYIMDLLEKWKEKYEILERNHSYIQWLFPLREHGMNSCAKPLTEAEIEEMKGDKRFPGRFLEAYKLMLDFYGIQLKDEKTGEVTLADNCESRFRNLNDHSHNNLRITRILKCLGELGFEHYQAPLVKFFLEETLCNGRLQNVKRSALDYFMFTVKNKNQRRKLVHFAWKNYNQDKFIWGPVEKLRTYQPPAENEQGANNKQKEKNNERDEESQINGQLDSCDVISVEKMLNCSDSDSENVESHRDSIKPDKKPSKECIPLQESYRKIPGEGSSKSSDAVYNNKSLIPSSSIPSMNGAQHLTEDMDKKSNEEEQNQVSYEVSPKHDHNVPSAVGQKEEGKEEGHVLEEAVSTNQNDNLQQENTHKDNTPVGTPRKRKRQNGEAVSDGSPPKSNDISGLPKEDGEDDRVDGVNDEVKKLKLSEQPGSERNERMADDLPGSTAGRDPQQPNKGSDINQEGGECSQMEDEEAKEETAKPNEHSSSEDNEKDDPSTSSASEDPK